MGLSSLLMYGTVQSPWLTRRDGEMPPFSEGEEICEGMGLRA